MAGTATTLILNRVQKKWYSVNIKRGMLGSTQSTGKDTMHHWSV